MSLFKRQARRVAAVGVGVGLLVLGLEAPAFAAPAISGISPNSGPLGCVVVITGTGFDQAGAFAITDVRFTGAGGIDTADALFHVVSDTVIWTTVPAAPVAATTGAITVTDGNGDSDNSAVFTVTTGASTPPEGTCGPTIASFTPTCGVVGTVVTITGTNLLSDGGDDSTTPDTDPTGGEVRFNPYGATAGTGLASHTGAAESPTTLVVNVPSGAADGPIRVDTSLSAGDDNVDSATSFNVVATAAECGVTPTEHARSVTLALRKHLVARGKVSVGDGFTDCAASVPVKIQRRRSGGWRTVGSTTTTSTGSYKKRIKDTPGKYRAKATGVTLNAGADVCLGATSPVRRHTH